MPRIEIIAPALDDYAAIGLIQDLAGAGYDVHAQGPQFGEEDINAAAEPGAATPHPDDMPPADRKAFYESELSRLEFLRQSGPGRLEELPEQHRAPAGWHIIASRADPSV